MTILICDDDPDIRAAMRRTLRGLEVIEATSPREALDKLKSDTFEAIISDYSMDSDADGLDLLHLVKIQYPDMIRFLVTANQDLDVVVRAVNEGSVHRYFKKPWKDEQLRDALDIVLRSTAKPGAR